MFFYFHPPFQFLFKLRILLNYRFAPGKRLPLHTHDPPEIYYIIQVVSQPVSRTLLSLFRTVPIPVCQSVHQSVNQSSVI